MWDLIKLKRFCTSNETIKNPKRQPKDWKDIFSNESTKGLMFKTYKHLIDFIKQNIQKTIKMSEDLNRLL